MIPTLTHHFDIVSHIWNLEVWHVYSDLLFDILSGIYSDILSGRYSDILSGSGAGGVGKHSKRGEGGAPLLKSRDPHLAGGE